LSSTLLFPSKISQELVVYRLDTHKGDTPVRILRITIPQDTNFIPMFQHTGREGEVTLMPGTTLQREVSCQQIGKKVFGKKYFFCDYRVTGTTELLLNTKQKIFSRMISKILYLNESVEFTRHEYESELVQEIVNEFNV